MILWLFLSRAPEHYHIVSKDGNCRKYISLCQRKNPNKFSLHSIEKPNDTQGSFGAILRIPLTKSFSSSIRIKTNSKDEDIQVPMCTNWSHPEWSFIIWCFRWCFVLVCLGFIFWFCFCCCWFLGFFFGYSKSYFSVNSNKDIITDTVVYVSFLFFLFFLVKL